MGSDQYKKLVKGESMLKKVGKRLSHMTKKPHDSPGGRRGSTRSSEATPARKQLDLLEQDTNTVNVVAVGTKDPRDF